MARYHLLKALQSGNYGQVFLAVDKAEDKMVAIKKVRRRAPAHVVGSLRINAAWLREGPASGSFGILRVVIDESMAHLRLGEGENTYLNHGLAGKAYILDGCIYSRSSTEFTAPPFLSPTPDSSRVLLGSKGG